MNEYLEVMECKETRLPLKLWVIEYTITNTAKGVAIVKAKNAKDASDTLMADSAFNAFKPVFNIHRIEEAESTLMDRGLVAEQYIKFNSN